MGASRRVHRRLRTEELKLCRHSMFTIGSLGTVDLSVERQYLGRQSPNACCTLSKEVSSAVPMAVSALID